MASRKERIAFRFLAAPFCPKGKSILHASLKQTKGPKDFEAHIKSCGVCTEAHEDLIQWIITEFIDT